MKILIDADIFIAIHNSNDSLRARSLKVLHQLKPSSDIRFFTTWDVIDEVATKLSYFLSKAEAVNFLNSLKAQHITVLYLNSETSQQALQLFSSISSKRVSMTDCANMVLFEKYQLDYLFSYDNVYQQQKMPLLTDFLRL